MHRIITLIYRSAGDLPGVLQNSKSPYRTNIMGKTEVSETKTSTSAIIGFKN
jgi:hypothetical protein